MMKRLAMLILLLLAACAPTVGEITRNPADFTIRTAKPPEAAAQCMARNIELNLTNVVASVRPSGDGIEMIARVMSEAVSVYAIANLQSQGSGSTATMWLTNHLTRSKVDTLKTIVVGC